MVFSSRTRQLEDKLDSLVSLLAAERTPAAGTAAVLDGAHPSSSLSVQDFLSPRLLENSCDVPASPASSGLNAYRPLSPKISLYKSSNIIPHIPKTTDDEKLRNFQEKLTPYFPFIVVPVGTTIDELRIAKPFLLANILMVMSYAEVEEQSSSRLRIMKASINQVFLDGNKSLELVQGTIIFAAWHHHHLSTSAQLTNMIQLATALVFDLGLHRTERSSAGDAVPIGSIKNFGDGWAKPARTLEERRAFLGLFCLTRG